MNNKGFAITTIIFGILILFMLLIVSFLHTCAIFKNNLLKLTEEAGGTRDIVAKKAVTKYNSKEELLTSGDIIQSGLYCFNDGCEYISQYNVR